MRAARRGRRAHQSTDDIANDPGTEVVPREISSSLGIPEPNGPQLPNGTVDLNAGRGRRPRRPATMERPSARGAPRTSRPYQITDDIANDPGTEVVPREISLRS